MQAIINRWNKKSKKGRISDLVGTTKLKQETSDYLN